MGKSVSVMLGRGSLAHNNRVFSTENVNPTLTPYNVVFIRQKLKDAYQEIFGEALEQYNQKQKRNDRKIPDYLEHIRHSGNGEKVYHELVVQVGNHNDTRIGSTDADLAKEILTQYYHEFLERNPNMRVFNAVLHMDEADGTPHLHINFIPIAIGQKRGLETKNSMRQALEQQGFDFQPTYVPPENIVSTSYDKRTPKIGGGRWLEAERAALGAVLARNGIEWDKRSIHREHLTVKEYKTCAELMEKAIQETPHATMETRVPTRPMRLAGVKEDEIVVRLSSVEALQQENTALRAQAELDQETIRRMDKEKAKTDAFVHRHIKSASVVRERAEKEAAAVKQQYSAGTAEKYNALTQKYNQLVGAYQQAKTRCNAVEEENSQLKATIPQQIEKAVEDATSPLQQKNNQLHIELERWKQTATDLQERVRSLCQTLVDTMRAVLTLKYKFSDKSPR